MSDDSTDSETLIATATATTDSSDSETPIATADESSEAPPPNFHSFIQSLNNFLPQIPISLYTSSNPAFDLLHDSEIASRLSSLLRHPNSGAGDNDLCRWLYDTFQSGDLNFKLVVLRFVPVLAGVYLSRVACRKTSLAGFEAVLLALYAHETARRSGQSLTVNIPDLSHPSLYHESKSPVKNNSTALNLAVISASLEPYGTVRSTKRARIVSVALELYFTKIDQMPESSKIEFCEFCEIWSGYDAELCESDDDDDDDEIKEMEKEIGKIPLPWEILQPILRILSHCVLGVNSKVKEETPLFKAARSASRSLYMRSMHDINPKAILAIGSLMRLGNMALEFNQEFDFTEIPIKNIINL